MSYPEAPRLPAVALVAENLPNDGQRRGNEQTPGRRANLGAQDRDEDCNDDEGNRAANDDEVGRQPRRNRRHHEGPKFIQIRRHGSGKLIGLVTVDGYVIRGLL